MNGLPIDLCRGCRPQGFCRFGVASFADLGGDGAEAEVRCPAAYEAGPRVAHGGWTAAMFDDVLGRFLAQRGLAAVTGSLTVDFLRPVPIEEDLVATVRIVSHDGRRWRVEGGLRLAGADEVLARATGIWIERRTDHFERHEKAMRDYRSGRSGAPG
jgi:acyl-coenzyme A thioesterase PaaI-like protein